MLLRYALKGGAISVVLASAGACVDAPTAPPEAAAPPMAVTAAVVKPMFSGFSADGDTTVTRFTVYPRLRATYMIGRGNVVTVPAGAVCDPALSSYGPGTWDEPCRTAIDPVTVTARAWRDAAGHPGVDFTPRLRFAPTDDPARMVWLLLYDRAAAADPLSTILFCEESLTECVDDAQADASLVTLRNPYTGYVYRRIKHFSGYNVAGRAEQSEEY